MSEMAEIYKLFHPETKGGKGAPVTGGDLSTVEKRRLIERAKQANIKLPKKGM